jgi:hypothetical protein
MPSRSVRNKRCASLILALGVVSLPQALAQLPGPQQVILSCTVTKAQGGQDPNVPSLHFKVDYDESSVVDLDNSQMPITNIRINPAAINFSQPAYGKHVRFDFFIDRVTGAFKYYEMNDGKLFYSYSGYCEPATKPRF